MRQQNIDRADVDAVLDTAFELWSFDLERLDWGLEVDERLDGYGLVVQVQGADDLRRDGSIFSSSVGECCQKRTRMPRVKPRYEIMLNDLSI